MRDLKNLKLQEVLPSSIAEDANIQASAASIDSELHLAESAIPETLILPRIGAHPEPVVDLLAWQYHVDFYDPNLSLNVKRTLVRDSIPWHRKKGTLWAVKKALRDLEVEPTIYEWFEIGTKPHTFGIEAYYKGDPYRIHFQNEKLNQLLWQAVEMTKPVRSHLLYLVLLPPDLSDPDHGCIHDVCSWAHGILPTVPIGMEDFRIPFAPRIVTGQTNVVTVAGVYERFPRFDMYIFGHPMPETGQRNGSTVSRSVIADRRFFGIWRGWHKRRRWSHGGTWGDHNVPGKIGVEGGLLSTFAKSSAVWGHASFDGLAAMKPRTWNVPDAGRLDENIYADRDGGGAEWMSIDEYGIRQEQKTTDIAGIWRNAEILRGERNVRSAAEAEGLRHEQTGGSALCLSGRILYTARERWWDNEPWDAGTWERSVRQYILSRFANATVTTITKEVEP